MTNTATVTNTGYYGDLEVAANPAASDFREFMVDVDTAIGRLNGFMNQVGIDQRSLSGKEVNLTESITANSAARSRIMDTDFAETVKFN